MFRNGSIGQPLDQGEFDGWDASRSAAADRDPRDTSRALCVVCFWTVRGSATQAFSEFAAQECTPSILK